MSVDRFAVGGTVTDAARHTVAMDMYEVMIYTDDKRAEVEAYLPTNMG